jgi:ATP adenylyltransferase
MKPDNLLKPLSLWTRITDRTAQALRSGVLYSIPTESSFCEEDGIRFFVRILTNLSRKEEAKKKELQIKKGSDKTVNPFLPYEEAMFVTNISDTHLCLLNKYNVVEHHILIVTREFEDQEMLMNLKDFEAMWLCMAEFDSLSFYNGGCAAGASQPHKHLQLVPLPLASKGHRIPIEPVFESITYHGLAGTTPLLPFVHAFIRLDPDCISSPKETAKRTLDYYHTMLDFVGLKVTGDGRQSGPYNLLVTREWMFLIPRSGEFFHSISVNSLGFAGALLVKNEKEMELLKSHGAMNLLKSVAVSRV